MTGRIDVDLTCASRSAVPLVCLDDGR